jgi:hypothetical protein
MNSNRAAALFGLAGLRHADARDQRRCKLVNHLPILRSDQTSVRLPFRLNQPVTIRSRLVRLLVSFKKNAARAFRVLAPKLAALSFAGVAHAQGTMDFSGARTLMGNVQNVLLFMRAQVSHALLRAIEVLMLIGKRRLHEVLREPVRPGSGPPLRG